MNRLCVVALVVLAFVPNLSSAVDIKNVRPCYGPLGPTRYSAKCLPGDVLIITYEIEGLGIDPKSKKVKYETLLELLDESDKVIYSPGPANAEGSLQLGGTSMPGDLHVNTGTKPGKYKIRLTITDKVNKNAKAFQYGYEVLPEGFGFVRVGAPAVGFPGLYHVPEFALVNLKLDAKTKQPDAQVTITILDDKGKAVTDTAKMMLPRDMPEGTDLQKGNVVPLTHPVYLNRTGRFTVEIVATDKNDNMKEARLKYTLTVLDVSGFGK